MARKNNPSKEESGLAVEAQSPLPSQSTDLETTSGVDFKKLVERRKIQSFNSVIPTKTIEDFQAPKNALKTAAPTKVFKLETILGDEDIEFVPVERLQDEETGQWIDGCTERPFLIVGGFIRKDGKRLIMRVRFTDDMDNMKHIAIPMARKPARVKLAQQVVAVEDHNANQPDGSDNIVSIGPAYITVQPWEYTDPVTGIKEPRKFYDVVKMTTGIDPDLPL